MCGPAPAHGDLDALRREVAALSRATGFPILPEAPSQLRFGLAAPSLPAAPASSPTSGSTPVVVSTFDALFRSRAHRAHLAPDLILELGAPPTSTGYSLLLADHPTTPRVVVSPVGWTDPTSTAAVLVHADVVPFVTALRARLAATANHTERFGAAAARDRSPDGEQTASHAEPPATFATDLARADARARALLDSAVPSAPTAPLTEAATARAVVAA